MNSARGDAGDDDRELAAWQARMHRTCTACGCRRVDDVGRCTACGARKAPPPRELA